MNDDAWREADQLSRGARWEDAGPKWEAVATRCRAEGAEARAKEAFSRAADAYRRDDRPVAAARTLRIAWDLGQDTTLDAAQLAAVLLDVGEVAAAADIAEAGANRAQSAADRAVGLDTAIGVFLAAGRTGDARAALDRLHAIDLPGGNLAAVFRRAQLDRLDGELTRAATAFAGIAEAASSFPAAAGAEAAAHSELGEIAELQAALGNPEALAVADEHFSAAGNAWQRARRRAGRFRAEAWESRVQALRGLTVIHAPILRALAYARARGLVLLEAELHACLGVVTRDWSIVARSLPALDETPLARGRARVLIAELAGPSDLDAALTELAADIPWATRARALHADAP